MKRLLLTIIFSLLLAAPAWATTYHVAKTGNNGNSCAQATNAATPKLTIQAGVNCAVSGDTVIVHAGTYTEILTSMPSGIAGSPTILQTNSGDTVTWTSPNSATNENGAISLDASYIRIQGFRFFNSPTVSVIRILHSALFDKSIPTVGVEIVNNTFDSNGDR